MHALFTCFGDAALFFSRVSQLPTEYSAVLHGIDRAVSNDLKKQKLSFQFLSHHFSRLLLSVQHVVLSGVVGV